MNDLPSLEDFEAIKNEVMGQTDRGAAILAASLLDEHLKWAIARAFVELSNKDTKTIFSGTGPLATFKARTDIAFALGLIDQISRTELSTVGQIRNRFAHHIRGIAFEDPEISEICQRLCFPARHPEVLRTDNLNRSKYLFSCWMLRSIILSCAARERPISPSFESAVEALADAVGATLPSDRSF